MRSWLGAGIVAGIAMFIWGAVSHMALPIGMMGIKMLPEESAVLSTLADKVTKSFQKENLILPDGRLSVPMGLTGDLSKPEVDDRITPILESALLEALIPSLN